ncbi:hypothetical protein G7050_07065 [Dysgonomonas sp. HDW5A]|uniref:hypothetical protein n=1 Tax=Dysgonomonas sp. HDW5A TaxID=2714926 RepID=UPI00140DA429|nr:hypothetical protein [Dysgonomonas sp. HDW5A]QIK59605.1 hypothetical protein G7050_07065 [Dysgonomonas sp. HDW5A]
MDVSQLKINKLFNAKIFVVSIILFCVNILLVQSSFLISIIGLIQFIILFYYVLRSDIKKYLIYSIIFLVSSFDVPYFVTGDLKSEVFSVSSLPFFKGHLFNLTLYLPILILVFNKKQLKQIKDLKSVYPNLYFLFKYFSLILIGGLLIGAIGLLLNENNILSIDFLKYYVRDLFGMGGFSVFTIYFIYYCLLDEKFPLELESTLFTLLFSLILSSVFSACSGLRGFYDTERIILMPLSLFFAPSILIFLFYERYKKYRVVLILLSITALSIQFTFSNALSGKSWLMIIYIFFVLFLILYQKKQRIILFVIAGLLILILPFISIFVDEKRSEKDLIGNKLTQVVLLASILDDSWYDILPNSPKIRIEELLNTIDEFKEKPYFMVFGKGFGGSIKDHRQSFGWYDEGAFTEDQYSNNSFIILHESFIVFLMKAGICGLVCMIIIFYRGLSNAKNNPWIVIGVFWFILFWGYSFSLGIFGIPCLVLGFYFLDAKPEDKRCKKIV